MLKLWNALTLLLRVRIAYYRWAQWWDRVIRPIYQLSSDASDEHRSWFCRNLFCFVMFCENTVWVMNTISIDIYWDSKSSFSNDTKWPSRTWHDHGSSGRSAVKTQQDCWPPFPVAATKIWNTLPTDVTSAPTLLLSNEDWKLSFSSAVMHPTAPIYSRYCLAMHENYWCYVTLQLFALRHVNCRSFLLTYLLTCLLLFVHHLNSIPTFGILRTNT